MLTDHAAKAYLNKEPPAEDNEDEDVDNQIELECQAFDGLLEHVWGQACHRRVKEVYQTGKLGAATEGYVWQHFEPDTLKSACEYLMAHKEPHERVDVSVLQIDYNNKKAKLNRDLWIVDEF